MINVTVSVDSDHRYHGISFLGHAGYADDHQEGQELVCAAVSALTLNMANSVEHFTDDQFEADEDEQSGMFRFRFTGAISPEAALLMNSLVLGLEDIEETYGEPYIADHAVEYSVKINSGDKKELYADNQVQESSKGIFTSGDLTLKTSDLSQSCLRRL